MDCTQALDDDFPTNLCTSDDERRQVGWLEVGDARHEVCHGENRIGRDPSLCQIVIDSKTLSKEHAVIEVCGDGTPFIYDLGSLNKTRLGKTVLQPEARYQLLDGSEMLFADIKAVYKTISDDPPKEDDSGSETGSESMLNISTAEDNLIPATPAPTRLKPSIIEETIIDSDVEDKPKPTFKSPETASTTEAPACSTEKEQPEVETDDIYEAETQADEFYASDVTSAEINNTKDGLDITDDIFAAETQCDESYVSAEEQGNEGKDESINRASRKSNTTNADKEKSICEAENQSLDHISPSQKCLKQPSINKLNGTEDTVTTDTTFENNKSLSTNSEKVKTNSKSSCREKAITFSKNNNLEKNNNCNKVGASGDSSETPADNINPVLDCSTDDDVDESIYEADTLCMESEFQFLTPKRPLVRKDTIEESENEEDITEMPTQCLDLQSPSPNHKKLAETRDSQQDISEMATQQLDLESASTKQLKSSETKDTEQDISEMATLALDLEPAASTKQLKSSETKDTGQDISEMATQQLDLEPTSTKQRKSSETKDTEQDISEMATLALDLELATSTKQCKSSETKDTEQDICEMATLALDLEPAASTKQLKSSETKDAEQDICEMATQQIDEYACTKQPKSLGTDAEQDISEMATQQLDLEPVSSNQHKSAEREVCEQHISGVSTQQLDLKFASTNELKSAETKDSKHDISNLATQQLDLEPASANQLKSAEMGDSEQKSLCVQVGKSESEGSMNKADEKSKKLFSENVEETLHPSDEDPSSPSLLQEDKEDLNCQEQGCSDDFSKKDEQMKGLNESTGKNKAKFQKSNVVARDLAVNKETFKTVQDNVATDSGDETDSENIFEAQTQLFCENNKTTTASEKSRDMHIEGLAKKKNKDISETAETKSNEIIRHPQEDDEDTKSEDLYETHLQAKTEGDRSSSHSSMINNAESSENNTTVLQHSDLKKSKECKENSDSSESDDIYEANTQIIDFDEQLQTNANINHTRKNGFENKINVTKKQGNHSVQLNPTECASKSSTTTDSKNSPKHSVNSCAEITKNSKESTASVQNAEEIATQKFPKVSNKTEAVITKSKQAKKEKVSTNLEEQDIENIFEAATQVIEDGKPVSPQPCTSKALNLEEEIALGSKPTEHNNESEHCGFSELEMQPIENEPYHTSEKLSKGKHEWDNSDHVLKQKKVLAGTGVELKSKQEGIYCSSNKASEGLSQSNQSIESDDSLMDAPTQILNEGTDSMPVNKTNVTLNQAADASSSKNKHEQNFEIKTHHKRCTPRKNQSTADNKPTTSMSSTDENQRTKSEMQDQVSPRRNLPADEEVAVSPTLPSRISKHAPVGKRRGNRNISSEIEKSVKMVNVVKTKNKKAAGVSKLNQSVKDDDDDHCLDSSISSVSESSVEVKQSSSKEIQGRRKRNNQGNKAEDSTSKNVSVHSKSKTKDTTESPASQNLRPSRQRKMTWKVRESLLSDQETSDSDKSSRKRSNTVLDNSDVETSTPIKSRKESSTKTDSVSEHFNDVSHSRAIRKKSKPELSEQSSSYQKNKIEENASLTNVNTSSTSNRATKRKAPDLQLPSTSKRSKGEQKSFTERENPAEDTSTTLLTKRNKNTESKTNARASRTTRSKTESATEVAVSTRRETRQASIDKSKSKNLKKQSSFSTVTELESESENELTEVAVATRRETRQASIDKSKSKSLKKQSSFSNVKELESESENELEEQDSVSAKSKSRKGNAKTSLRLAEQSNKAVKERKLDLENQEEESKLSPVADSSSKLDIPQRRSRRTAKEVENEKRSKSLRQKKINVEERPDPGGSSKDENNTKMVETQEKERSSYRRKRKASNADTALIENEEYSESPSKRSRPNSRKASGKLTEVSDNIQTSTPSTSKSDTPNKSTPRTLNRKGGKNSITTPKKKEDQSHSRNDIVNVDSDSPIITPKRASRRGDSQNSSSSEFLASTPQRSTPRRAARNQESECRVLFTGISDAKQEAIVKTLGGTVVDLPESCTVLVTDKVRRTFKFLCIMGKGKPIVSPMWLTQSKQAGKFLDPWKYLIKDQESESKFHFSLRSSLERASKTNLLADYNIFVTPKVLPPPPEMRGIVESCGGTYIPHMPSSIWPEKSFIISCKEDKAQWTKLKKSGKPIVGAEILLLGVLQQKLDIKSNTLV